MKYTLPLFPFLFLLANALTAQVQGVVTSEDGEPLPFASVYVQGTTNGTTTNLQGEYFLELEPGKYQLVFQFIGFEQRLLSVEIGTESVRLDVELEVESVSLREVEIRANAEDPAYPIIRKAIEKRKYYKELVEEFACDVYIKGNVKILDAPEKILGQEVGDMSGSLDTNRQGIVYLSESVSELYFRQPDQYKEIMVSSKVSGSDNGFSFNSAQDMDIDLYRNFTEYGRSIISPIAEGAMNHYRYRLEGVMVEEDGRLINKIALLPKSSEAPVYQGFIYIVDGLWNIQSSDIFLTGSAVQMPLFDTLFIKQTYVPVAEPDVWRLFSQTFTIAGGAFGFKFGGSFTGIYRDYDLAPRFDESFFGNEVMRVEDGANEKDSTYWEETRPVPLTVEEEVDYHRRDSIRVVRESKPYLDSIDQERNKFELTDLLFGYTWRNSWKRRSFNYEMPLATVQFNAVQGLALDLDLNFRQAFDKNEHKLLTTGVKWNYGFAEKKLRAAASFQFNFNPKKYARVRLQGGQQLVQFNEVEPISPMVNTNWSLMFHRHEIRLYDKKFLRFDLGQELANGVFAYGIFQYANRSTVENNSDYSFLYKKSRGYEPNRPVNPQLDEEGNTLLDRSNALVIGLSMRLRPGQKYFNYPDQKYIIGSKFPDIWLHYRKGIPINPGAGSGFRSDVNYDRISAVLQKRNISLGLVGMMDFRLVAGTFLNADQVFFQDFKHFLGNEIELGNPSRYLYGYKRLPYYEFSTRDTWFEGHWEHRFRGFFLDKIPLLKKLDWGLVAGANFLYTSESKDYFEASLGLDNIGFGIARLFRFDVIGSFRGGEYDGTGFLIGVNLPLDEFEE